MVSFSYSMPPKRLRKVSESNEAPTKTKRTNLSVPIASNFLDTAVTDLVSYLYAEASNTLTSSCNVQITSAR